MKLKGAGAILSQLYHLAVFASRMPRMRLEKGVLIISVDVDVGSRLVGEKNKGNNDVNVHDRLSEYTIGKIEELALPLLIQFFDDLEIPVTFAVRGQLTETDGLVFELLRGSSVKYDIGAHGYYHRAFTNLSQSEAENELKMISADMRKFHIEPRSFVFPKNKVAHLSLLEKYGYRCYRGYGNFRYDGLYIEKHGQLYDVHPGFFLGSSPCSVFLNKIIDISVRNKLPFHLWFHPHDLGNSERSILRGITRVLLPIIKYAKRKEKDGLLSFETMYSVIEKLETTRV